MSKVGGGGGGGATTMKKKKGRPSQLDIKNRAFKKDQLQNQQNIHQISTHRNPNSTSAAICYDDSANEDENYDDDDDERRQKKVKLVGRQPQSNQLQQQTSSDLIRSSSINSASYGSVFNADADNCINNSTSVDVITDYQDEKISKAMDNLHGSPIPLPDKKLLDFILDRLQKKDTYGVFSEPVDCNELPDYHEIIEYPMDFGTVKSKLEKGLYSSLDELESDVLLICSNAMQYNSSDTIYFRQARTIQELAIRDFGNLRQEGEPKVVKRGRPPSKKPPGRPLLDHVGPTESPTPPDNTTTTESTPYNLRRGPLFHREQSNSELLSDWNEEFPVKIRRADMKYGNIKDFVIDETRRDTYNYKEYILSGFGGEKKRLMAVGDGYSRSLTCFADNLGPVVWKVALKKMDKVLPYIHSRNTDVYVTSGI